MMDFLLIARYTSIWSFECSRAHGIPCASKHQRQARANKECCFQALSWTEASEAALVSFFALPAVFIVFFRKCLAAEMKSGEMGHLPGVGSKMEWTWIWPISWSRTFMNFSTRIQSVLWTLDIKKSSKDDSHILCTGWSVRLKKIFFGLATWCVWSWRKANP